MHMYNGRIRLTKLRPRVRSIYPLSPSVLRFTKPPARNQRPRALPTEQILAHLKDHGQLQLTPTLKFPRLALTKCHFSNSKNSKAKGITKILAKRWWYLSEFDLTTKFIFVFVCLLKIITCFCFISLLFHQTSWQSPKGRFPLPRNFNVRSAQNLCSQIK